MRSLVIAGLLAAVVVAAPVPKSVKPKERSLDGQWITTERSHNGAEIKSAWVWVIDGEKFTAHSAQNGGVGAPSFPDATTTFTRPDPSKADEYDYTYRSTTSTIVYRGRVKWDGDEWVFCFGQANGDRPAEVKTGNGVYLNRFKRIADK
jgi:hypothetical protein